ncbi:HNH endonuclease [Hornefia butyriciproducens]|uniref:HNH endonuclease n=1 Tax=Hornefia butyriciproducens TaxID=2652293 RepID=UPI003F8CBD52
MIRNLKEYIEQLIREDQLWKFYKTKEWRKLKEEVLRENHHECDFCKRRGRITRYDRDKQGKPVLISTVHHVMHVKDHPEMALSKTYFDADGEHKNLIPVCKSCHNELHPEKARARMKHKGYENKERW